MRIDSGRADEDEARLLDALGEVSVFRQEAIAGMNGFSVCDFCGADDGRHRQIALRRGGGADTHRLIGQLHVFGFTIRLRVDDDGLDAHFSARALYAERDFTAVGNENFFKHGVSR